MTDNELIKSAILAIKQTWHFVPRTSVRLYHSTTNRFWLKMKNPAVISSAMQEDARKRLQKIGCKLNGWDMTLAEANFFLEVIP